MNRSLLLTAAGALLTAPTWSQTLIIDDFEVDTSANYNVVDDGSPDGTSTFAFDYSTVGIPSAPRSTMGDTRGVRFTANDTIGQSDAITAFHNTVIVEDRYRLTVDVWVNFVPGSTGSTEHAHVGVGGDASITNSLFLPITGSGAYIAFDGDGDSGSDYRWFRDSGNTPMGESDSTTLPNTHPSYLGNGSNNTGGFFQALFPAPPATVAGSPGNLWTTVSIDVNNTTGVVSFFFDGQLTFQGDFAGAFNGFVSLGLADVFSSQADPNNQFLVYDNLLVEVVSDNVGANYCMANPNSTGNTGSISAVGSDIASANDLTVRATQLPMNAFGFFITSLNQGFVMNPNGSAGNLCVSGAIGRYVGAGQIQNAGMSGSFELTLDLNMTPSPTGFVTVSSGETRNWQAWHRDSVMGTVTSNFTDGVSITFQ